MGKHFDLNLKDKSYENVNGKKITGAAYSAHIVKTLGGIDIFSNNLFEIGYNSGFQDGYANGITTIKQLLQLTNKNKVKQ